MITIQELVNLIQDPLEIIDVVLHDTSKIFDYIVVRNKQYNIYFKLNVLEYLNENKEDLISILNNKRMGTILIYKSRIVGYYSNISNWNKSKLGELRDRQSGNYTIS